MPDEYLKTDERADVICSLQMTLSALKQAKDNSHSWKWVILTLHNAIQGAMVCHLSGSANLGACTKQSARKWRKWHDGDGNGDAPELWLANPKELFKRLLDVDSRIEGARGGKISTDDAQKDAFKLLCELRKPFTHFQPKSWLIQIAGLPNMVLQIVTLIEAISNDGWSFRHADYSQKFELSSLIKDIRAEVP